MSKRAVNLTVIAVICIAGVFFIPALLQRLQPSVLCVHVDSIPWQTITVESSNLSQTQRFDRSVPEIRVSPISHGIYRIVVQLSDGECIRSEFFHHDTGARRRIDVSLKPSQRRGYIHFTETMNQQKQLFEGDARPADTTEEKPFHLDGI